MSRWSITVRDAHQRVPPFEHLLAVEPHGCDCAWVARNLTAATALIDRAEFYIAHPELKPPEGDVGNHVRHTHMINGLRRLLGNDAIPPTEPTNRKDKP